jgi:UDP-glucose 4-epimerase
MKVLITGGAGYIGTELVHRLLDSEQLEEVVVYDNLSRKNHNFFIGHRKYDERVTFKNADILDGRSLMDICSGMDVVVHLAAKVEQSYRELEIDSIEQVNNWGTSEVVSVVDALNITRSIYLSSTSIYGHNDSPLNVDSAPSPTSPYGISKFKGEKHFERLLDKGREVSIVRAANVFGYSRSMRFDSIINRLMFDGNFGHRLSIHGDGTRRTSFIHIDRLVSILFALITDSCIFGYYNAVDYSMSLNEIVGLLREIYEDMELIYLNQDMPINHSEVLGCSDLMALAGAGGAAVGLGGILREFATRFTF